MNTRTPIFIYIPVLLAMFFWSFSFIWYKQVFNNYNPVTVIFLRLVIAVPLLFIVSLAAGKMQRIQRRHFGLYLLLGFFEPFLYFLGECYGVNMISATLASVIISIIPLLVPIPAKFIFREKFSVYNYLGLIISIIGVFLVVMGENRAKPAAVAGVFLMLLAVFSAVGHSIFVRKLSEHYNTFTIVTYQSTIGLVYFIPLFCFVGFSQFIHSQHTFYTILPILKLAVFASSLAFLLFVYSIQRLGMAKTNVFVNLIPVFTAVLSYIFLKEKFTMPKIIGITVVIAGLIVSQYNYSAILSVRTKKQE